MKPTFDIGTNLKCLHNEESRFLVKNEIYSVHQVNHHGNIRVKNSRGEISDNFYMPNRFAPVKVSNKIDLSKRYRTRQGQDVRLFTVDRSHSTYPVLGEIGYPHDSDWQVASWTAEGKAYCERPSSRLDLIEVPTAIMGEHFAATQDQITLSDRSNSITFSREAFQQIVNRLKDFWV